MAWFNSEIWRDFPIGELSKKVSVEFINAVNERFDVHWGLTHDANSVPIPHPVNTLIHGIGTWASDHFPVYADFAAPTQRPLESWVSGILDPVRAGIERLISVSFGFYKPSTISDTMPTLYTDLADLLNDGTFGSAWLTATRAQDADLWIQVREALDNLIWPVGQMGFGDTPPGPFVFVITRPLRDNTGTSLGGTVQAAWTASRAEVHTVIEGPAEGAEMLQPGPFVAFVQESLTIKQRYPSSYPAVTSRFTNYTVTYNHSNALSTPKTTGSLSDAFAGDTIPLTTWVVIPSATEVDRKILGVFPTGTNPLVFTYYPVSHPWSVFFGTSDTLQWTITDRVKLSGNLLSLMTYG